MYGGGDMSDANPSVKLSRDKKNYKEEFVDNEVKGDGQPTMKRPGPNEVAEEMNDKKLACVKRQAQDNDDDSTGRDVANSNDSSENSVHTDMAMISVGEAECTSDVILLEGASAASGSEAETSTNASQDSMYKGIYNWNIPNAFEREKLYSDRFEIGTYTWRLLIFPRGNLAEHRKNPTLSVFLDAPEAPYTPTFLTPHANFTITVHHPKNPQQSIRQSARHTFSSKDNDWGFSSFVSLQRLRDEGFFQQEATLWLSVEIEIQPHSRFAQDSRAATGFVGIKNQGATCYMNSLLQSLFHINAFRKAVYRMPAPENDEPSSHLHIALQCLFFKLQYSHFPVSTKDLTKSFGWSQSESFMQHDVQELNRVLCERLEVKMKGTKVEKEINRLFEGYMYNFIRCKHVNYTSTRRESFMDLQLDVKGCPNVDASFKKFCEVETLDGENRYKTDDYGLQEAEKGILFSALPPVLQLQLKRYEYDFYRDVMVKINDRYEFEDVLDLNDSPYLAPDADRSIDYRYRLHSVLVHCGSVHGGHYLAFIRPDGRQWFKFDDDYVTRESDGAVFEKFGGRESKVSNAYLLVYVRESEWAQVMCPAGEADLADHLRARLHEELERKERRRKQKAEAHLYFNLRVASDSDISRQVGHALAHGLVDYDALPDNDYRMRKTMRFGEFKEEVARRMFFRSAGASGANAVAAGGNNNRSKVAAGGARKAAVSVDTSEANGGSGASNDNDNSNRGGARGGGEEEEEGVENHSVVEGLNKAAKVNSAAGGGNGMGEGAGGGGGVRHGEAGGGVDGTAAAAGMVVAAGPSPEALAATISRMRFWVWSLSKKGTFSEMEPVRRQMDGQQLMDFTDFRSDRDSHKTQTTALLAIKLYLEVAPEGHTLEPFDSSVHRLIFLKFYDFSTRRIRFLGHLIVHVEETIEDIEGRAAEMLPETSQMLVFFEGVSGNSTTQMREECKQPLSYEVPMRNLMNGAILVVQERPAGSRLIDPELSDRDADLYEQLNGDDDDVATSDVSTHLKHPTSGNHAAASTTTTTTAAVAQTLQQLAPVAAPAKIGGPPPPSRLLYLPNFLSYVNARRVVEFRRLSAPRDPGFAVEFSKDAQYRQIALVLAFELHRRGLAMPRTAQYLRLTIHGRYTQAPLRTPLPYMPAMAIDQMLVSQVNASGAVSLAPAGAGAAESGIGGGDESSGASAAALMPPVSGVLYYEVLDRPLPVLERVKMLPLFLYNDKGRFVREENVEVARGAKVEKLFENLRIKLLLQQQQQMQQQQAQAQAQAQQQQEGEEALGAAATGGGGGSSTAREFMFDPNRPLLLTKILGSRVYEIVSESEPVEALDPFQWDQLRVEMMPEAPPTPTSAAAAAATGASSASASAGDVAMDISGSNGEEPSDTDIADADAVSPAVAAEQELPAATAAAAAGAEGMSSDVSAIPDEDVVVVPDEDEGIMERLCRGSRLVPFAHVLRREEQPEPAMHIGEPFVMNVGPLETVAALRQRLAARLDVAAEEVQNWDVAVFVRPGSRRAVADEVILLDALGDKENAYVGLIHEDRGMKRPPAYKAPQEGSIRIAK